MHDHILYMQNANFDIIVCHLLNRMVRNRKVQHVPWDVLLVEQLLKKMSFLPVIEVHDIGVLVVQPHRLHYQVILNAILLHEIGLTAFLYQVRTLYDVRFLDEGEQLFDHLAGTDVGVSKEFVVVFHF